MSINISLYKIRLITVIDEFLNEKIDIDTFCRDLSRLWIAFSDENLKIKESWDRRYDVELQKEFVQGKITANEFRERYNKLCRLTEFEDFTNTINPIHGLCDFYNPIPETEWEVNEAQFRAEVKNIFENSKLSSSA
jgi:hypothetical protein